LNSALSATASDRLGNAIRSLETDFGLTVPKGISRLGEFMWSTPTQRAARDLNNPMSDPPSNFKNSVIPARE
jgi:hypothetical protein